MKEAEIHVMTPLHIGSGEKISPIEYILENEFTRVQMDALFRDESFDKDKFIQNAMSGLYLGNYYLELGRKYPRYSLEIKATTKKNLLNSLGSPSAEIREFIRTADRPFVPGTSIKGAIRTVLLWKILQDKSIQKEAEKILMRGGNPKYADNRIEELAFGKDPNHDLLKSLQVYDSSPLNGKDLEIKEIRTLTLLQRGFDWKKFLTFVESLKVGSKFVCEIKKDDFYFSNTAKELGFSDRKWLLDQLPEICNEFAKEFINAEIDFFNRINFREMKDFYLKLKREANGKESFLLHLAWGSGWHGMTVGRLFQYVSGCFDDRCTSTGLCRFHNTVFCILRKQYKLGAKRRKNSPPLYVKEFPKTRKIVFENGKPAYPMGWVKVSPI